MSDNKLSSLSNENFDAERNLFLAAVEIGWWQVPDGSKRWPVWVAVLTQGNKAWPGLRAVALGWREDPGPEMYGTVTGWEEGLQGGGRVLPAPSPEQPLFPAGLAGDGGFLSGLAFCCYFRSSRLGVWTR